MLTKGSFWWPPRPGAHSGRQNSRGAASALERRFPHLAGCCSERNSEAAEPRPQTEKRGELRSPGQPRAAVPTHADGQRLTAKYHLPSTQQPTPAPTPPPAPP